MKLLSIDTSTRAGSVALLSDDRVLASSSVEDSGAHAIWLMGAVDSILKEASLTLEDIDLFALSTGPGSFTGLRIGVSTVKGLAWPGNKPVVGVSALKALAMNIIEPGITVCPVFDARKKELYTALYRREGEGGPLEAILKDSALTSDRLFSEIRERGLEDGNIVFTGDGLRVYKDVIKEGAPGARFAPKADWLVRAENVARLALAGDGERVDAGGLTPVYLRKSEAELKRPG